MLPASTCPGNMFRAFGREKHEFTAEYVTQRWTVQYTQLWTDFHIDIRRTDTRRWANELLLSIFTLLCFY